MERVKLRRKTETSKWFDAISKGTVKLEKPKKKEAVIAVDPGVNGAIAFVCRELPQFTCVMDMPKKQLPNGKNVVDAYGIAVVIRGLENMNYVFKSVTIENVHAMPKDGGSSGFSFGRSLGKVEGVFEAMTFDKINYVGPAVWKKYHGLTKARNETKREAKARALELARKIFPECAEDLELVKHTDRGEALLMGAYALVHGI